MTAMRTGLCAEQRAVFWEHSRQQLFFVVLNVTFSYYKDRILGADIVQSVY